MSESLDTSQQIIISAIYLAEIIKMGVSRQSFCKRHQVDIDFMERRSTMCIGNVVN